MAVAKRTRSLTENEKCGHSPLFWLLTSRLVNENQKPLEFVQHRFLREMYSTWQPNLVLKKAAQLGLSTMAILRSIHFAAYRGANIAYVLPNRSVGSEFLIPKWNPIIEHNPAIRQLLSGTDTPTLKKIGNRYIYFRGGMAETEAISISVDGLIGDEYDRMPDQSIMQTYQSRLDHADPKLRFNWILSNPSTPDVGVDHYYKSSTQKVWLVTCSHNHELELKYPESLDQERGVYQCSRCHTELTDRDRIRGRWAAKSPGQAWEGYSMSQLQAPWIPATKILQDAQEKPLDVFYNFTLGEAYAPADAKITRSMFMDRLTPGTQQPDKLTLGVDNGVTKTWVLNSQQGVVDFGQTDDWNEIERIFRMYGVSTMVIDHNPYPATPRILARKYKGRVWLAFYTQDKKAEGMIRWGKRKKGHVVEIDRTKMIDHIVLKLSGEPEQPYLFHKTENQMDQFIQNCTVMYRISETTPLGEKSSWITPEGRADHLFHAWLYSLVALEKMSGGAILTARAATARKERVSPAYVDLDQIAHESLESQKTGLQR